MSETLSILQHALGLDPWGRTADGERQPVETYRNHFVTGDEGGDGAVCNGAVCNAAVAAGLMIRHQPRELFGGMPCFTVTDAGRAYVLVHSPPPPKVSRGRARYLAWLRVSDCCPDLTFGDWLKGIRP